MHVDAVRVPGSRILDHLGKVTACHSIPRLALGQGGIIATATSSEALSMQVNNSRQVPQLGMALGQLEHSRQQHGGNPAARGKSQAGPRLASNQSITVRTSKGKRQQPPIHKAFNHILLLRQPLLRLSTP